MERTEIQNLKDAINTDVTISGWVDVARDQGKMAFFDFRDGTGFVQGVVFGKPEVLEVAKTLRPEWVVTVTGKVNARPEKMINEGVLNGDIELEITGIEVLSKAHELPFDLDADLNLDTLLDYRPLTIRTKRARDIFKVAATIVQGYRSALIKRGFTEFQAPALVGGDAEGGAEVFKVEYFNDRTAFLATSPQLYKEIMTGAYERAFTIAKIFRAEKSATTRHLSEVTQMDFEMSFIRNHLDVMSMLEEVVREVSTGVSEKHLDVFKRFAVEAPLLSKEPFPILTLIEAQEILEKEFGGKAKGELDLTPEHERQICEWAKKEKGSDFVFITEFPTAKRAFYTYPDPENPERSYSFDLLFRGLEINSGSQRFHNYDEMVETIKARGMDPEKFSFYLQMHKYGIPPHGGCSTGLERFTARMLELSNVKEAVPFPRDMNRIDTLLSE
ncbi:MAG: aspartate--tRNA(Asn) ligase [Candidatus Paceibacterota bacterium]